MTALRFKTLVAALTLTALPGLGFADNTAGVEHPLWFKEPSAKTMELAKIDDLSNTVVSDGSKGETGFPAADLKLTEEQIAKVKAGEFTVAISMGWMGDDWASQQLIGLKETFESLGVEVVAETNANWDLNDDLRLSANYTWTETKIQDSKLGNPKLTDTPEHIFNASLKWQAADDIQLWLRGEYRSERARYTKTYANLTAAEREIFDNFGDYKAYSLLHVGSNFAVNENVDIGIAFYNIFDTDFMSYELVPNTTTYTNRYSNSQEGRRVQLSTTFKF